jgi:hypothetical protein
LGAVALICYIAWLAWDNLGPHKPEIGPVRREFADKIIPAVVDDLRTSRGNIRQAALLHFENDPTDYFTNQFRAVVEQSGILDLRDRTVGEKIAGLTNLRHTTYGALDAALARGRDLGAQGVIFGTIHSFESHGGGAAIDLEVCLADVSTGQVVFSRRYNKDTAPLTMIAANVGVATKNFPWFQRLFGWLIAVLLLPVFTIAFIRTMVRKGSNKTNAFVLGVYTLADALLAWLLVGAALNSWFPVVVFIAAVAVAFLYNIRIMTFALRLEEA